MAGGLAEPLWRDAPRSDDESISDDSEDDANSSIVDRLQKVAKRRSKAKKREKRGERRNAAADAQTQSRARRQSEAVVQQARASTQRRASAPENAMRRDPSDSELYGAIAAALHLPKTDASIPQALILRACQQLGIPLGSSDELYENPVAMASATQEVLRALGLSMDSTGRQKAAAAKLDETLPAWRVGAVDVLNMQRQPVAAQEPRRQRRRSRGHIQ